MTNSPSPKPRKKVKLPKKFGKTDNFFLNPIIERVLWNAKTKRITAVDIYDPVTGRAYFCEVTDSHISGI